MVVQTDIHESLLTLTKPPWELIPTAETASVSCVPHNQSYWGATICPAADGSPRAPTYVVAYMKDTIVALIYSPNLLGTSLYIETDLSRQSARACFHAFTDSGAVVCPEQFDNVPPLCATSGQFRMQPASSADEASFPHFALEAVLSFPDGYEVEVASD